MTMDIAITGMSVRLPASDTPWQLHELLADAGSAIERFDNEHPDRVGARGIIQRHDWFDSQYFRLAEAEASRLDPQHRLALEEAVKALESAGYRSLSSRQAIECGVFASCSANQSHWRACLEQDADNAIARYNLLLANDKDFLATRIAWHLDLTGPAITVQSGCSSGLAALHQACQALRMGECSIALVAGVSLTLPLKEAYPVSEGMIFSSSGSCCPFTEDADGTIGGTGAVVLVLQPLEQALLEGAPCWGIIKGSAVNNDGRKKVSFTAPSIDQQIAVMQSALKVAGVKASDIGFIEGHGTATSMGDAIELAALSEVYGCQMPLPSLGSIKANIGHLDAASGLAGVAKCLLSFHNQLIYPQPHKTGTMLKGTSSFALHARPLPWRGASRMSVVTSLGVGGTNVHMVLGAAPPREMKHITGPFLIPLAASTGQGVQELARQLREATKSMSPDTLPYCAWTLQQRYLSEKYSCRCHLAVQNWEHWQQQLQQVADGTPLSIMHCEDAPPALNKNEGLYRIALPATPLDSHSIPSPADQSGKNFIQPEGGGRDSDPETLIVAAWQKCLGFSDKPTTDTHFFEAGGNSLLSVQLIQALKQQGFTTVNIADIYAAPKLSHFVRRLKQKDSEKADVVPQEVTTDYEEM
ncbi:MULTISPECIES: beta-ketoacyl synthase N-terminal-like domain-containing protein [Pectobacterium]|uniref:Beta-ketoacyl synthase N-terminal-like domain-containing protein n=1 Tax=Pectobacterium parvum TaxID=2778550 RepID=A0AAP9IEU8_9GAMM|nr:MULTISPECIES: polyketide synthase [Pectobacterium]QHQ22983.1 polyketide synthase, type I [Pectobacterium parvum]